MTKPPQVKPKSALQVFDRKVDEPQRKPERCLSTLFPRGVDLPTTVVSFRPIAAASDAFELENFCDLVQRRSLCFASRQGGLGRRQHQMGKIIGIDLGTTNSVVCVMDGKEATVIVNEEG